MFRTALIGTAIVAGCVIGGCNKESSKQAVPSSVTTPANKAASNAESGVKDAGNTSDQAKIAAAFQKLDDDLKAKKIDDAASDIKDLQGMKNLSAEEQTKLQAATTEVQAAQNVVHGNPATMPAGGGGMRYKYARALRDPHDISWQSVGAAGKAVPTDLFYFTRYAI